MCIVPGYSRIACYFTGYLAATSSFLEITVFIHIFASILPSSATVRLYYVVYAAGTPSDTYSRIAWRLVQRSRTILPSMSWTGR